MQEPPIPFADRDRIRDVYYSDMAKYGRDLPKHVIARLIIDSGLSPKKYTEKWLSIRVYLGADPHPIPPPSLVTHLTDLFMDIRRVWRNNDTITAVGRKSMPNYNCTIRKLLLMVSTDIYERYSPWFPSITEDKVVKFNREWNWLCDQLAWPVYEYFGGRRLRVTFIGKT